MAVSPLLGPSFTISLHAFVFMAITPRTDPLLFPQVPLEYHDYLNVFSEEQANTLPPHRKYDLEISLQPGTVPPWGPIYGKSALELA